MLVVKLTAVLLLIGLLSALVYASGPFGPLPGPPPGPPIPVVNPSGGGGGGGGGNSNSGIGGTKTSNPGTDTVLNVLNYGALCNNTSTNDDVGIQAAYNASQAIANTAVGGNDPPPVYIPAGVCITSFPLIFSNPSNQVNYGTVRGAGGAAWGTGSTRIYALFVGPAMMIVPNDYVTSLGTISTPAITGNGNSLQFNNNEPYFLLLNEVPMVGSGSATNPNPLSGLGALTVQMFFKATGTGTQTLLVSSPAGFADTGAITFEFTVGGALKVELNIGGSQKSASGGTVTAGTTYWAALSYDGAHLRGYLATPGSSSVTPLGSTAATGTITQAVAESMSLGGIAEGFPPNGDLAPFTGQIQSVDIESTALYTGTVATAPSANFTGGANTLYLNNFTQIAPTHNGVAHTPLVSVDYLNGGAQSNAWQTIYTNTYDGNARGPQVEDMVVQGGFSTIGLFLAMSPQTNLRNLNIMNHTYGGLLAFNNTYNSILDNIYIDNDQYSAFGLGCGWAIGQGINISATGGYYQIASSQTGCGLLVHPIETGSNTTIAGIRADASESTFSEWTLVDNQSDMEAGGNPIGLEVVNNTGGGFIEADGGSFSGLGTGCAVQFDGNGPRSTFSGSRFFPGSSCSHTINFVNNGDTTEVDLFGTDIKQAGSANLANSSTTSVVNAFGSSTGLQMYATQQYPNPQTTSIAGLPACNAANVGLTGWWVTNATSPCSFGNTPVATSSPIINFPVRCWNDTGSTYNWRCSN